MPIKLKKYKLGEITENIFSGGTPSTTNPEYWGGELNWLSSGETSKRFIRDTDKKITELGVKQSSTRLASAGDIVIASAGQGHTRGQTAYCMVDTYVNQSIVVVRAKKELVNSKYLFYNLSNRYEDLRQLSDAHSVRGSLTTKLLKELNIDLPDYNTQEFFASLLSCIDEKIEHNLQMNKTLEELSKTIYKEWFINFRYPGFDGKLIDDIPIGFKKGVVSDIYETTSGGTPSRTEEKYYINGTIKWVKSKELNGEYIFDTEEKITEEAVKYSSAKKIPRNSILIAMYGATVGEYAILSSEATCNQAICAIIPNNKYPYSYFWEYLKLNKDNIISQASGSAQQNISQALIQRHEILIPPITLVNEFHNIVVSFFEKIENNLFINQNLIQLRRILLPKLMSGVINIKQ